MTEKDGVKEMGKVQIDYHIVQGKVGRAITEPKMANYRYYRGIKGLPKMVEEGRMEAIYLLDPTVHGAINTLASMLLTYGYYFGYKEGEKGKGVKMRKGEKKTLERIKEWEEYIGLKEVMEKVVKNALIFGNAYVEKVTEGKLTAESWGIKELRVIHPATMFVETERRGGRERKRYYQRADGKAIMRTEGTTLKGLMNEIGGKMIEFKEEEIAHFKWNAYTNREYGNSTLRTVEDFVNIKLGMIEDMAKMVRKTSNPIMAWLVGDEEHKAISGEVINAIKQLLSRQEEDLDVVVPYFVRPQDISLSTRNIEIDKYMDLINDEILKAMGVPDVIFGGLTGVGAKSGSEVKLEAFVRMLKSVQKDLSVFVRREFIVHLIYGGERSWKDLTPEEWAKVPSLFWREIESVADLRLRIESLTKNGVLGVSEAREMIGLKPEYDVEDFNPQNRLYMAQARNYDTSSEEMKKNTEKVRTEPRKGRAKNKDKGGEERR